MVNLNIRYSKTMPSVLIYININYVAYLYSASNVIIFTLIYRTFTANLNKCIFHKN